MYTHSELDHEHHAADIVLDSFLDYEGGMFWPKNYTFIGIMSTKIHCVSTIVSKQVTSDSGGG